MSNLPVLLCCSLTLNCLSHSFRSSAFFLLNAMSIKARSSVFIASKPTRCLPRSLKYFFASADVLVPRPCTDHLDRELSTRDRQAHLVVLGFPTLSVVVRLLPLLVLWHSIECHLLLAFPHPDDGCDELDQEFRDPEQRRVEVVKEVNDQTFDMRTVVILYLCQRRTVVDI